MSELEKILEDRFGLSNAGVTWQSEMRAGLTTFMTMAYILLVNPAMLSNAGMPFDDVLFATAIASFVGCVVMGMWANLPFALAPGMGLNAYFTFTVVGAMGIPWQVALAAVFVEGLIFLIISLPQIGWRTKMINSIPQDLKIATGAGIGMFLALIGLQETGIVINNGVTLVGLDNTASWTHTSGELWAIIGIVLIAAMMARGITGSIVWGILGISIFGWALGVSDPYNMLGNADPTYDFYNNPEIQTSIGFAVYEGIDFTVFHAPAGWGAAEATAPTLGWGDGKMFGWVGIPEETLGGFLDGFGDVNDYTWSIGDFLLVMITFLFVDIFDTAGTLYSVGRAAGYVDDNDELQNSDPAFMSDAAATLVGAMTGTSTTTTYIESAAGVEEGGKTGLVAVTVGVLFLSGLFLSGLFQAIPTYAAACALVIVGSLMMRQAADINWADLEVAIPAFITMILMPFTYSIAAGIAWGIIAYVLVKLAVGKYKEVNPVMTVLFVLMVMFYLGPGDETTFEFIFSKF
ncbi:MAG: NCS2 family permease [Euryarchaeota archaeon]|jgi:AGZA family xanthine/uracil permease-like MFS transporter|nr:NCS2 family permease [Euryarchaeota archaeon]MBT6683792.1 NCS2 family permease [Euryarchaeota archaeon]MBT6873917.1 NCS2 family permease [Euryarchaeota archaeon]MBT7413247.1 NCS2 family permease [Euryarchaeota archaeon]